MEVVRVDDSDEELKVEPVLPATTLDSQLGLTTLDNWIHKDYIQMYGIATSGMSNSQVIL